MESPLKTIVAHSLEDTRRIAREWLGEISGWRVQAPLKSARATIVGLSGHLGAGKTAFVKAVAAELGVAEEVTSPTFVIMKIYQVGSKKNSPFEQLVHMDAYRLENAAQLEALRFEALAADPTNLIMVEWPENVGLHSAGARAENRFFIWFEAKDEAREISYSALQ